mgnify:FL=1
MKAEMDSLVNAVISSVRDVEIKETSPAPENQKQEEERMQIRPPDLLAVDPTLMKEIAEKGLRLLWAAPDQVEAHQWEGYEVVERPQRILQHPGKDAGQVDGAYRSREITLMAISEAKARRMEAQEKDLSDSQVNNSREQMEEKRDRMGHSLRRKGYSERETRDIMGMFEVSIGEERG